MRRVITGSRRSRRSPSEDDGTDCKLRSQLPPPQNGLRTNRGPTLLSLRLGTRNGCTRGFPLISLSLMVVVCMFAPRIAHSQTSGPDVPRRVESELIFEGQGSFGNYKIFAAGEDSKLFSSGVEYDRHSWRRFLGANVYYVAEFLPFVLLDQPAKLNYYGIPESTKKDHVPGVGINPLGFRMIWRDGKAIKPYLMAKGGFLVFSQKAESPYASYENLDLHSEVGLQFRLTERVDFRMGMGDYHFSNQFVVPSNPGLDVMAYDGGISFHLGSRNRSHASIAP
jgi:Lipid A 3-O-deacylase (PagL)